MTVTAGRYFAVVPLHSPLMRLALALVGLAASLTVILDARAGGRAVVPVIVVQMFAASTGFAVRARRGHLDLLLTAGPSRFDVAAAHLTMSVTPGLVVWTVLGLVEMGCRPQVSAVWAGGSIVAMTLASGISWALTVPFPRLSGGIGWTLVGVTILAGLPAAPLAAVVGSPDPGVAAILLVLGCPVVLAGRTLAPADAAVIAPALAIAAGAVAWALAWMTSADVALEASQ